MKVLNDIAELYTIPGPTHLAIGVFDGVHVGHQAVIGRALQSAKLTGGSTVVVTFHPHPVRVLRPGKAPRLLTSTQHKIQLIRSLGVDALLILRFTLEFSKTPPERFIEDLAQRFESTSADLCWKGMVVWRQPLRLSSFTRGIVAEIGV
jgi:riboflavin kinase/FMN adenylyltransferase